MSTLPPFAPSAYSQSRHRFFTLFLLVDHQASMSTYLSSVMPRIFIVAFLSMVMVPLSSFIQPSHQSMGISRSFALSSPMYCKYQEIHAVPPSGTAIEVLFIKYNGRNPVSTPPIFSMLISGRFLATTFNLADVEYEVSSSSGPDL